MSILGKFVQGPAKLKFDNAQVFEDHWQCQYCGAPKPQTILGAVLEKKIPKEGAERAGEDIVRDGLRLNFNGKSGYSFSLMSGPPDQGGTCVGCTSVCTGPWTTKSGEQSKMKVCYTKNATSALPSKQMLYQSNTDRRDELMEQGDLVGTLLKLMKDCPSQMIRIHDSGDFDSPEYIQAWIDVAELCNGEHQDEGYPRKLFRAFTRSFPFKNLKDKLYELASLPNVDITLSADKANYKGAVEALNGSPYTGISFLRLPGREHLQAAQACRYMVKRYGKKFEFDYSKCHAHDEPDTPEVDPEKKDQDKFAFVDIPFHFGRTQVEPPHPSMLDVTCPATKGEFAHTDKKAICTNCRGRGANGQATPCFGQRGEDEMPPPEDFRTDVDYERERLRAIKKGEKKDAQAAERARKAAERAAGRK